MCDLPGVNQPGLYLNRLFSGTEFQVEWNYVSISPYAFMACVGTTVCLSARLYLSIVLIFSVDRRAMAADCVIRLRYLLT